MRNPSWKIGALCLALLAPGVRADVRLPAIFSDNMVLQQGQNLPIWGWADTGEKVTVSLGQNIERATADATGQWRVILPPQKVAESLVLNVTGKNSLSFQNVAVGEVWLCLGQSNMKMPVADAANSAKEIAGANFPQIRLFKIGEAVSPQPATAVQGKWDVCTPEIVRRFSATAYFFGRELHQKLGAPIGLIEASHWNAHAESWMSRAKFEQIPALKTHLEGWDKSVAAYPALLERYQKEVVPQWQAALELAKADGREQPIKPDGPVDPATNPQGAGQLFNGMIAPLVSYSLKGVICYQGEGNVGGSPIYRRLFPALITDWRSRWGEGDFPFYWVQLANHQKQQENPVEDGGWPLLREAQSQTLSLPRTGMATAIDLADADNPGDIHPKNKQDVGRRLALIALANDYGQKTPFSGPVGDRMNVQNGKIHLVFRHFEGGLRSRGEKLQGFAIAGEDGVWKWAEAKIEGKDTVVLSHPEIAAPTKVRYNWAINPIGNLENDAGLPAVPFRTDGP